VNPSEQIVYLDNNATTQLDPAVLDEMLPFLTTHYCNPSSGYALARRVRGAIDLARERVAALFGCEPTEIVFTSGGTESNNAAINSALQLDPLRQHVVTTSVEHSATRRHCEHIAQRGNAVAFARVDSDGNLDLDEVASSITGATAIVSIMWANNETGVIFPIERLAELARGKSALFHTDAVQAAGKIRIRLADSPINFLSLSAHKLHGPKGVGALYINRRSAFHPLLIGGGQENSRRAGTENVASIVGFGKAAECAAAAMHDEATRVRAMRDRFESAMLERIPQTFVNGGLEARLPNTTNLAFLGIEADAALMMLDRHQICCSAGSACRTGSLDSSHVLRAMNLGDERARGSMRFSFGRFNTDRDVDKAIEIVPRVMTKLRGLSPVGNTTAAVV